MSKITEQIFDFINKFKVIAESEAKIKFDLTECNQYISAEDILTSEKVFIPEINAYW